MAKILEPVWIEKSVVLCEGKKEPIIAYNMSINDKDILEISYEQLVVIRDMIDKITKEN